MKIYKKVTFILFFPFVLLFVIVLLLCNNMISTNLNQNKLETSIIKIIQNTSHSNNIKIQKINFYDSKMAFYYSYGDSQKQYATGLFEKTLLPPYVKMIFLSNSDSLINQSREPITDNMSKNINILLFYNKDKKVKKIKLKYNGKPVSKSNEYIDISNSEVYFGTIEMKNNGTVYFDKFFDENNSPIIP